MFEIYYSYLKETNGLFRELSWIPVDDGDDGDFADIVVGEIAAVDVDVVGALVVKAVVFVAGVVVVSTSNIKTILDCI